MGNYNLMKYSVRIAVDERHRLKGSGVLFLRNYGNDALIFTVAHLFNSKLNESEISLFIDIVGDEKQAFSINRKFKIIKRNEDIGENVVIIHKQYNKSTLDNDIAILRVKWENWMKDFHNYGFMPPVQKGNVVGWGFPAFMQSEQEVHSISELKARIKGDIETLRNKTLMVNYKSSSVDADIDRAMETDGFSGTALFCEGLFVGCISKLVENPAAGSRLIVCAANQYLELMNEVGIKLEPPDDLIAYGQNMINSLPKEKKALRNYLNNQVIDLIESDMIKPCIFLPKSETELNGLPCKGFREMCSMFWKGALISAFCFVPLKEIEPEKLPCFQIKTGSNCLVKVVFVCTEATMPQSIQRLMDYSFFNSSDKDEDGVVFLWNNEEDNTYYNGSLSKTDSQNIIRRITEDYLDYDIKETQRKMNMFHIVNGDRLSCNIAAIGIGQLWNHVLMLGNGNKENMIKCLDMAIESVWN